MLSGKCSRRYLGHAGSLGKIVSVAVEEKGRLEAPLKEHRSCDALRERYAE